MCVCVLAGIHVCSQKTIFSVIPSSFFLLFSLELHQVGPAIWPARSWCLLVFASPDLALQVCVTVLAFPPGFWGSELR